MIYKKAVNNFRNKHGQLVKRTQSNATLDLPLLLNVDMVKYIKFIMHSKQ